MRLLFSGSVFGDGPTLRRLQLLADEIGFIANIGGVFALTETDPQEHQLTPTDVIVGDEKLRVSSFGLEYREGDHAALNFYVPPSDPISSDLYREYISADLNSAEFRTTVVEGLGTNKCFAYKLLCRQAGVPGVSLLDGTPSFVDLSICKALYSHRELITADLPSPRLDSESFNGKSVRGRKQALSDLIAVASIKLTHTMLVSCITETIPVTDDPFFARLLSLRTAESKYIGGINRQAPFLGLEIVKAVIPDEALQKLSFEEIGEYRARTKDARQAWSVELNKMSSILSEENTPLDHDRIQKLIASEISPRLVSYRNEMKATRDEMFASILKSVLKWEMPTLSLAYLSGLGYSKAIVLFASALAPTIPHIVDYVKGLRASKRNNSLSYLVGLTPEKR
jgi:hypothetical protein